MPSDLLPLLKALGPEPADRQPVFQPPYSDSYEPASRQPVFQPPVGGEPRPVIDPWGFNPPIGPEPKPGYGPQPKPSPDPWGFNPPIFQAPRDYFPGPLPPAGAAPRGGAHERNQLRAMLLKAIFGL
jgi:hypothetical protein